MAVVEQRLSAFRFPFRHCEEQSDEAIQTLCRRPWIASSQTLLAMTRYPRMIVMSLGSHHRRRLTKIMPGFLFVRLVPA